MKKMIAAILALAMAFSLAACSSNSTSSSAPASGTSAAATEATKDSVVIGLEGTLTALEPMSAFTRPEQYIIANVFNTLFKLVDGEYVPELATEFALSDDLTSISVTLRDDVYFHNGEKMTADDVVYTFNHQGDFAFWESNATYIDHAEMIDDTHVVIYGKMPTAYLMSVVSNIEIINEKAVTELDEEHKYAPVGTGPYKLTSYDKINTVQLEVNEDYFMWKDQGMPAIKSCTYKVYTDKTALANALEAGEVDLVTKMDLSTVGNFEGLDQFTVDFLPADGVQLILYNCGVAPFDNKLVRQAVAYAVDRESLNLILSNGMDEPWDYFYSENQAGAPDYDSLPHYTYDPEKAKELLAEAGYPDGIQLDPVHILDSDKDYAVALQSQLQTVGINFDIEILEQNTLFDEIFAVDYQMIPFGLSTEIYDMSYICNYFKAADKRSMLFPVGDWTNEELDALITQAENTSDLATRKDLYTQIYTILYDEQPVTATLQSMTAIVKDDNLNYSQPDVLKVMVQNLSWN